MNSFDEKIELKITELARKNPDKALNLAKQLVRDFPEDRRSWASLAYVHEIMHDYAQSLESLRKSEVISPLEPVCNFNIGRINIDLKNYEEAVLQFTKSINKSISIESDYYIYASAFLRAYSLCCIGEYDRANIDIENLRDDDSWWIGQLVTKNDLVNMSKYGRKSLPKR